MFTDHIMITERDRVKANTVWNSAPTRSTDRRRTFLYDFNNVQYYVKMTLIIKVTSEKLATVKY